jgi:hypothetical protein
MHCWVGRRGGERRRVQSRGIDLVGHQRRQDLRWRTNILDERARRREESIVGGERTGKRRRRREGENEVGRDEQGLASYNSLVSYSGTVYSRLLSAAR